MDGDPRDTIKFDRHIRRLPLDVGASRALSAPSAPSARVRTVTMPCRAHCCQQQQPMFIGTQIMYPHLTLTVSSRSPDWG